MHKYIHENDTKHIEYEYVYDEDRRLCEYVGSEILVDNIESPLDTNISYMISVPEILENGTRQYNRWFKKHGLRPYIKVRKIDIQNNMVIGTCRISIFSPKYITGYNENLSLSAEELNILVSILNDDVTDMYSILYGNANENRTYTKWNMMIRDINNGFDMNHIDYHIPSGIKIPNYNNMTEGDLHG